MTYRRLRIPEIPALFLNAVQFGLLFVFSAGKPDELIQIYSRRILGVALVDLYQKPEYQG